MSVSLYFLLFRLLAVCKNKSVCVIIKLNNIEFGESSMLASKMEYMGDAHGGMSDLEVERLC